MTEPTPAQLMQAAEDISADRLSTIYDAIAERQELLNSMAWNHPARQSVYDSLQQLEIRLQVGRVMVWQRQHPRPPRPTPKPWTWPEVFCRAALVVLIPVTWLTLISWLVVEVHLFVALGAAALGIWLALKQPWKDR